MQHRMHDACMNAENMTTEGRAADAELWMTDDGTLPNRCQDNNNS